MQLVTEAEKRVESRFRIIDDIAKVNTRKVLSAFWAEKVDDTDLVGSTGYGYDDYARDKLERIYARVFATDAAIVRPQIISGTHALRLALFGMVRPGQHIVVGTGQPYDTLESVLGLRRAAGDLLEWNVTTTVVPLASNGTVDVPAVAAAVQSNTALVMLQKSRGYQARRSLSTQELGEAIQAIKAQHPDVATLVDNCYGEFVEVEEPGDVGADVAAGSLIKNPGAGLATTGGYLVGATRWIDRIASQVTAPGVGLEAGPTYGFMRSFYQGLFLAPHTVGQALRTSVLFAELLTTLGYEVYPEASADRSDLILSVKLNSREALLAFCRAIQAAAPIDAHVIPQDAPMPGYAHPVVMAAGAFVQGSSIDLSADGPIRPPYIGFLQGGLTYEHGYIAALSVAEALLNQQTKD